MVKYANSLIGKEFRIVLQAAAFVLFEHIEDKERLVWAILGHLSSYIFQTHIFDKNTYISKLKMLWTNKPKFHILVHMVMSVHYFGLPSLFATQTFKNCNTLTFKASINSN
ncbi:hypothetical protein CROQUDRAFT_36589 [Cronartium quercuum f. sp. fusiforme G11]|uniref:Uncharacterized protein n=1 Tax=Cronartium quercuum f. sp. fusiforme G11 TaxID=708437 RepID=A0A9P6NWD2_9BASI|nr:hypothetical protein CROQUDRAFT_36589 [Cronartium quercuum f. sp. fusiforme G11]